ncbi:MAG: NADH-quinone oxidoreductase subunit C [Acidimicrobiia bacterium]
MTSSPSDTEAAAHPLQSFADHVAEAVGGTAEIQFDTIKLRVPADQWADALTTARDDLDLVFFSWLSAIDWANDVEVGDTLKEGIDERIELLCTVGDLTEGRRVTFSTDLSNDKPSVSSLVEVYAGANWHEREAAEMFGIVFKGHPNLEHLYLLDSFIGNPLRKSYPLLSREVKPWPGSVDVEAMPEKPSTENPGA